MATGAEFCYQIRSMTMNAISRPPNLIAMILRLTDVRFATYSSSFVRAWAAPHRGL